MKNLTITLIQTSLHWENIDANLQMFSEKIAALKTKTDLIILPEMFSTGFSMNAQALAEEMHKSKAVEWMQKTAAEKNCVITGSLMTAASPTLYKGESTYYNRLIWMNPNGSFQTYDKRHLFSFAKEDKIYSAGKERLIVEINGWKICPLICFDLRFPVWSRNRLIEEDVQIPEYDVLLYVANWPERRNYAWKQLLIARAIENQSYVIGVNRIGNDGSNIYHSGDSMVIDALGKPLYHKENDEDVFTIELNCDDLKNVRQTFQFLKEADTFVIDPKFKMQSH